MRKSVVFHFKKKKKSRQNPIPHPFLLSAAGLRKTHYGVITAQLPAGLKVVRRGPQAPPPLSSHQRFQQSNLSPEATFGSYPLPEWPQIGFPITCRSQVCEFEPIRIHFSRAYIFGLVGRLFSSVLNLILTIGTYV